MSFLSGITSYFGGQAIKDFPFTIGEESEEYNNTKDCDFWKLHQGTHNVSLHFKQDNFQVFFFQDTGEIVSIFVFNKKENSEVRTQAATNCFKVTIFPLSKLMKTEDKKFLQIFGSVSKMT